MALKMLLMILASFCLAVAGQENERKNIKMLFVPANVMKALRNNLTTKDLPPGLPGQGTQRWTPVRLPGDKTHTFEIRINPRTAHKLNMNFQHFRVGRGHGLLLELKNVSLSTKGKTVLDRLVEFYKNCGSGRNPRIGMHMMHSIRHPHTTLHHSLLLPGDVPLLKRIQHALERFFPKRHDGTVDVFQHKDSSGAVHFLPFDEVRREVNNLIKRTLVKRDCVKISTDALTRALDAFRRQHNNDTTTTSIDNETLDENSEAESDNSEENREPDSDNESEEKDQVLSFSRGLDSLNPHPVNKVNLTSSSAMNVPSDAAATKIVSALADLRKEISDLTSGFKKKVSQTIPKDSDSISVGTDDDNAGSNTNIVKNISSDNNDTKDGKNTNLASFDISDVKNRRKKMSSDDGDEVGRKNNNFNNNNNNNNNNKSISKNNNGIALALKLKNIEEDLKTELGKDLLKHNKNVSKIAANYKSVNGSSGSEEHKNVKISSTRPVNQAFNQVVNHLQRVKAAKEVKVKEKFADANYSDETKKINKQVRFKGRKERARHRSKHIGRFKDKKHRKRPSVVFHYKPKSLRLKLPYKGGKYVKADEDDDEEFEEGYPKHRGKGRLIQYIHMRRRHPKIKEVLLPDDEEESEGYRQRNFDDSAVEAGEDENNMKVRLLKKLRWLRLHGRVPKIRSRKSPKLRVVVYDDDEEEKEPHHDSWRSKESDELAEKVEKVHEDDSEADSESELESESETEPEPTAHRSEPFVMDDENTQQYNQGEMSNSSSDSDSESDTQYLSDSIGDDSSHLGRSDSGADVPDLEPYLKKHYEDEEDEENEEIKMYNDQDGIDARKLSDSMDKSKTPKEDDTILDEKTNKLDDSDGEQPGKIHIHKIPFKIQEDSDGVDTSLLKEQPHNALGLQQVLSHEPDESSMASPEMPSFASPEMSSMAPSQMSSMVSQPVPMAPGSLTPNQNAMDMSPNMVMPPEQSTMIPAAAELPQVEGGSQMARPNVAAFTGVNYQPSVTTQVNSMNLQTPFPQVSSMMPMQPVMQPGQMRAVISRREKSAPKSRGTKKHSRGLKKGNKRVKLTRKKSRQPK
ncbi:uncharacterized protein LOC144630187 [Oculina patagonica]